MWDFIQRLFAGNQENRPDQVRLGSGVVITTAAVVVAAGVSITGIAWALSAAPSYGAVVIAMFLLVVVIFLLGTWRFADKHPDQAALGGTSWLKLRQLQLRIESKGASKLDILPPTANPELPPPDGAKLLDGPDTD
jgi:hypothetical protein